MPAASTVPSSAASSSPPTTTTHAALAVLLRLNGLRVSEACATNVEGLGHERGHRTLRILGTGNKPATIPLVPRTARTIDPAVGERCERRSRSAPR
jgi:site-specific recombinase XerC